MNNKIVEEILGSPSHNALIGFQAFIRNNILKPQEVRIIQRAFTSSLKEKEKENCDLILEAIQVFIQRYHEQLMEWLYILIVQLAHRQSSASNDGHIRALQETADLIRNLFPQRLLLQLSCKFVMDSVQIINSKVKYHLLQFIRVLVVSSKPTILEDSFPDLIMAVSRIISWTADLKSIKVRQESERVIQKLYYLNSERLTIILKSLPSGFQERAKIILKDNSPLENKSEILNSKAEVPTLVPNNLSECKTNVSSTNIYKNEGFYPRPGLCNKSQTISEQYANDGNVDHKEHKNNSPTESIRSVNPGKNATVTYADTSRISRNLKKLCQQNQFIQYSQQSLNENENSDIIKDKKIKKHSLKMSKYVKDFGMDGDQLKQSKKSKYFSKRNSKEYIKSKHDSKKIKTDIKNVEDHNVTITNISHELSRFNERHQERKQSLLSLIKCINSDGIIFWDSHFKTIMPLLLETLGDNEGGTRKLAIISLQELAKAVPERFQDQIFLIIDKLLHCFLDHDQGIFTVIEAVKSCAVTFACCLNVDTLWRTLNVIVVDQEQNLQAVSLKFISYAIRASSPVIVSCLLVETLTLLHKFTRDKNIQIRKNSIYCLITLYKKIGDKIWPHLKNFEKPTVRLLKIYIHRL